MRPLKILLAHNRYLISGGERQVFEAELNLLRDNGHDVEVYIDDNRRIAELGSMRTAAKTIWSSETHQRISEILRQGQFDLVHVHNFFPLISPSIFYAAQAQQVPVIQTLHNFRLLCVNGTLFREDAVCEACVGRKVPWPGVRHACYRESRGGSATVAAMLSFHRAIRTWSKKINTYIALTEFSRQKLIEGGLPSGKIAVKPNFIANDPGQGEGQGNFALYVGRLSSEKGITPLLAAWRQLDDKIPLRIVGDGPLSEMVSSAAASSSAVEYLGRLDNDQVLDLMRNALFLVFPSLCYENFPLTIIEAFATGLPVLTSDLGNAANLVQAQQTGLHFKTGDTSDLARAATWMAEHPEMLQPMRLAARRTYEENYTPAQNYQLLCAIYEKTIASNHHGKTLS